MSANADVKISVKLADSASAGLLRSLGLIDAETGKVSAQAAKAGGALDAMGKKLGSGSGALKGTSRELDTMASKAKRVGDNLKSGLSTALSRAKEISSTLGRAGMATAGAGTAAYMGLKTQMPYDRALGRNAAIMYGTKAEDGHTYTKEEAKQQKTKLDEQIIGATKGGVVLKNDALLMQQTLLKSGKFSGDEGMARLDSLMGFLAKVSASTGTSGEDLGNMTNAFIEKGLSDAQVKAAIGKGMVADNAGMYGMDSMAKYLPQWLANAGGSISGEHAADVLFAHAQSVRKTAGTDDEAGNNLANFISFAASDKGDKALADRGVNRKQAVEKYMNQGEDNLSAYAHVIDDVAKNDKHYQALKQKVANAKNDAEKASVINEMAEYTKQGIIGEIVTDVQARKAMFGINDDRGKNTGMKKDMSNEDGSIAETSHNQRFADDATSADNNMKNAAATGVNAALQELTPNIKAASDAFAAFASANPKTTGAGVIGAEAVAGGGLALALPKLLSVILGEDKTEKVSKKSAKTKGAAVDVPETHAPPTNKGAGKPSRVGRGVKAGGALALASMVADPVLGMVAGEGSAVQRYGSAAMSGAATGAFLGSLVPIVGTAVGAAAGGAIGMALEYFKPHPDAGAAQPVSNQMPTQPTQISAPQSEQLVIANAQLQQVNAQIAQLQQVANNEKLLTPLGQIQSGIAALNSKPWAFSANNIIQLDGRTIAQSVNTFNGVQAARG